MSLGEGKNKIETAITAATLDGLEREGLIAVSKRNRNLYIFSLRAAAYEFAEREAVADAQSLRDEVLRVMYRRTKGASRYIEVEKLGREEGELSDVLKVLEGRGLVDTRGSEAEIIATRLSPDGIQRAEHLIDDSKVEANMAPLSLDPQPEAYIAERRIEELRSMKPVGFDFRRLVQICEELNKAAANGSYVALGALQRTIMHHVPSIFGHETFESVAAQVSGTSFKRHMKHLHGSMKNVADQVLHRQAESSSPPVEYADVDFRAAVNELIQRVIDELS